MIRVAPLEATHREAWDSLVIARGAGFMQSWAWSELKELEGYRALRLGVFAGDTLAGGGIGYVFPTPAEGQLAALPDGPALDWRAPTAPAMFDALVSAFETATAPERVVTLRIEPRLEFVPEALDLLPRSPVDLVPVETLEIALGPEAVMLAAMKPKGRYNIRLAQRRGVEITSSVDPADVHQLYPVLEETARYQGFVLEPKSFFINLARALVPRMGRFAFARYHGMMLAAALTVRHGATVTFLYGGHLPLFHEVMASYALHWHVLAEAAREGYRVYDFYGYVPPGSPSHPYEGFSRFKEKFGGRAVRRMGSRDVVFYDRLAEAALSAAACAWEGS